MSIQKMTESECKNWGLHNFEVEIDNGEVIVERCVKCGHKKIYKKVNKQIDNQKYFNHHGRDLLQPFDKKGQFKREYGKEC